MSSAVLQRPRANEAKEVGCAARCNEFRCVGTALCSDVIQRKAQARRLREEPNLQGLRCSGQGWTAQVACRLPRKVVNRNWESTQTGHMVLNKHQFLQTLRFEACINYQPCTTEIDYCVLPRSARPCGCRMCQAMRAEQHECHRS